MKRKFFCAAILIILTSITACGSEPTGITEEDYNKIVAERDMYKELYENTLAKTNQNEGIEQQDEISIAESNNSNIDNPTETNSCEIGDYSVDEIVEGVWNIINVIPVEGSTFATYEENINNSTKIINNVELKRGSNGDDYSFRNDSIRDTTTPNESIQQIGIRGIEDAMDGTIIFNSWYLRTSVTITIKGYERAESIYDKLEKKLAPCYEEVSLSDRKQKSWGDTAKIVQTHDNGSYAWSEECFLSMQKRENDFFSISAALYTMRE